MGEYDLGGAGGYLRSRQAVSTKFLIMEKAEFKRESGIVEIKGDDKSKKAKILEHFESKFSEQDIKKFEREKTQEELELIREVNEKMMEFVERYGGAYLEIKPENIHIIDLDTSEQLTYPGHYNPANQEIILTLTSKIPKLMVANLLVHEMIHFNSFQSVIIEEAEQIRHRRVGLDVALYKDGKMVDSLFRDLNEAVTEELTKKFDFNFFGSIQYTKVDAQKRNAIIDDLKSKGERPGSAEEISFYISRRSEDGKWETKLDKRPYNREREYLREIIDGLLKKDPGRFESKEQIFELFARAAMSGDLRPITVLIEETLGPGSFKKIGQKTRYNKSSDTIP